MKRKQNPWNCTILWLLIFLFLAVACKKNESVPSLTTRDITNIQTAKITTGGDISSDGGSSIISQGMCWSTTNHIPTVDDSKTTDHHGIFIYSTVITNLTPNTTYYIRAFAQNSTGIGYGDVKSFKTFTEVTDYDGNVYHPITIGTQVWLLENLKVTHYNDGSPIINANDSVQWSIAPIGDNFGAYCSYGKNENNTNIYGRLYNWNAINTGKLCPSGWHVPTLDEWNVLGNFIGAYSTTTSSIAGGKIKESGTSHWASPNTNATNETEFTALPGGSRISTGQFFGLNFYGIFWSSSAYDNTLSYSAFLYSDNDAYGVGNFSKKDGCSVRCIKD